MERCYFKIGGFRLFQLYLQFNALETNLTRYAERTTARELLA
jgi:hypothetical protein